MLSVLRPAAVLLSLFTLLLGVLYPLAVTRAASAIMPFQARGSLVEDAHGVRGSALLGQSFKNPAYFWGRPSATSAAPYDAAASTGSNLGPTSEALVAAVTARVAALRAADPTAKGAVPVDLVTSSASGLDPHLSPAGVFFQVARVARIRNVPVARVRALAEAHVTGRTWGILGEPRVDVLALNRALDAMAP